MVEIDCTGIVGLKQKLGGITVKKILSIAFVSLFILSIITLELFNNGVLANKIPFLTKENKFIQNQTAKERAYDKSYYKANIVILDTVQSSPEHTLFDMVKENRDPNKIKPEKHWLDVEPETEIEKKIHEGLKVEQKIFDQMVEAKKQLKESKDKDEQKQLESKYLELKKKWLAKKSENLKLMREYGYED